MKKFIKSFYLTIPQYRIIKFKLIKLIKKWELNRFYQRSNDHKYIKLNIVWIMFEIYSGVLKRNERKGDVMKQFLKSNKGITLIALVVSIIVLLILAGIGINMLSRW